MATYVLEILDGDRAGETLPVADRTLRIGRKPGNDLVLADEKTSGVHAEVTLEGDRHVLRDLGSTNGTFLDGKRVTEIVLTPGDVVTVGRLRVKFREEGAASGDVDPGELAVRRLDASRLQRRGGSTALLGALVVVGLGVGGWLWWQKRSGGDEGTTAARPKTALVVDGNRLASALASCESEEGWNVRAAGAGFQATNRSHSGSGAFEAVRTEGPDAADFAMLRLTEPVPVLAGRTMTLVAHLQCDGGAEMALRAVCFPAGDQGPFRFRTGAPFAAHAGWQRVETVVAVPSGCDRMQIEVVAVLPHTDAIARVDDVALLEAGQAAALELKLAESSQTLFGTGASVAIRSTDPDSPSTLLGIVPEVVPATLAGLDRAGLCVLSDLGASLVPVATERSFQIEGKGLGALQFVFPADAAGGLLAAPGDDGFVSLAAESEFSARRVLLGDRATRLMVQFPTAVTCRGQLGGGLFRLHVQAATAELVLGFRAERRDASELVRQARARLQEGQPGSALDVLRELARTVPHDSEVLSQGQALRTEIQANQASVLRRLQQDLDEAAFFDTRGGFERVALGVDELVTLYGEQNLEDAAGAMALRERATLRLRELDSTQSGVQRQRLEALHLSFVAAGQKGLATLVASYRDRHFGVPTPDKK